MHNGREWYWRSYADAVRQVLGNGPNVLDVGTPYAYRKELGLVAPPTPAPRVWTLDHPGTKAVEIDVFGDATRLPFRGGAFDGVICKEVLEHVRDPAGAASEIVRVLRPGGRVFVTLIFVHPYHADRDFGDYWRFTKDAAHELFPGLDLTCERAGGWAFVLRSYAPSRVRNVLNRPLGTSALNVVDRLLPSTNATLMYYIVGTKR